MGSLSCRRFKVSSRDSQKNSHKGKDRQLASQSTSTPFINVKDSIGCRKGSVSFDTHYVLDTKKDKLTALVRNLTTQNKNETI